jgi:diguanylate cyclase (GGDEF)-like protein
MNAYVSRSEEATGLHSYAVALLSLWTAVVGLSLWWNLAQHRPETAVGLWWGHGLLWLLGQGGIIWAFTRLQGAHDRIITLMYTDTLTGIANRRIFMESLNGAISFAQRHQTPLSIIMADLDDFKSVNDTWGHRAGDQVLQAFATRLREHSRQEDLTARYGGEEFIIMLPGTGAEGAVVLGERLRRAWQEMTFPGFSIRVTASFGVSAYQPGDTLESLVERADQALYEAKRLGKNQVIILAGTAEQSEEETQKIDPFLPLLARDGLAR